MNPAVNMGSSTIEPNKSRALDLPDIPDAVGAKVGLAPKKRYMQPIHASPSYDEIACFRSTLFSEHGQHAL